MIYREEAEETKPEELPPATPAAPTTETTVAESPTQRLQRSLSRASLAGRKHFHDTLSSPKPAHAVSSTRAFLSDLKVIQSAIVSVEALWTLIHLYPQQQPPPSTILTADIASSLTSASLWAPFALWIITGVVIPLVLAFFCNVPSNNVKVDPLTFSISRGLIAYIIYGNKVSVGGLLNRSLINQVNSAYPGRWVGMIIAASLGTVESIYHAILTQG